MISKIVLFVIESPGAVRVCEQRRKEGRRQVAVMSAGHCALPCEGGAGPALPGRPPLDRLGLGALGPLQWERKQVSRGVKAKGMRTVPGFGRAFLSSLRRDSYGSAGEVGILY